MSLSLWAHCCTIHLPDGQHHLMKRTQRRSYFCIHSLPSQIVFICCTAISFCILRWYCSSHARKRFKEDAQLFLSINIVVLWAVQLTSMSSILSEKIKYWRCFLLQHMTPKSQLNCIVLHILPAQAHRRSITWHWVTENTILLGSHRTRK